MNGDVKHLIDCSHHQGRPPYGVDIGKPRLAFILRHLYPCIARDVENTNLARCVFHADEEDSVSTLFLCVIHVDRIIQTEDEYIGVAVKTDIHLTAIFFLPDEIRLIHIAHIAICLYPPANDIVTCNANCRKQEDRTDEAEDALQECHTAAACPLTATLFYILTGIFAL